jgi:hypothetical protein
LFKRQKQINKGRGTAGEVLLAPLLPSAELLAETAGNLTRNIVYSFKSENQMDFYSLVI